MVAVGLDVGTGFVKCVCGKSEISFPSIYAYRQPSPWEKTGIVRAVGHDAVKMSESPGTVVIRPVMQGCPVNEQGFAALVTRALDHVLPKRDAPGALRQDLHIVVGLPYEARPQREALRRTVARISKPTSCHVVPQAIGTLVDLGLQDGIIASIGQGTTEVVAFKGRVAVKGVSSHHAVNDITSGLGLAKTGYTDFSIFGQARAVPLFQMLADAITDDVASLRHDVGGIPLVFSGGGIMIQGLQDALRQRLGNFAVPDSPVMSNALGLCRLAESC